MNDVGGFCRAVGAAERRGELTRQQSRTLVGQAKKQGLTGALKGLKRIYEREEARQQP